MDILPLGSVVRLKNGDVKLMIISRAPLSEENNMIGYYDYSACMYPMGQVDEKIYFFNKENIEEVYFEGYTDEQEKLFQEAYEEQVSKAQYPKFYIKDNV